MNVHKYNFSLKCVRLRKIGGASEKTPSSHFFTVHFRPKLEVKKVAPCSFIALYSLLNRTLLLTLLECNSKRCLSISCYAQLIISKNIPFNIYEINIQGVPSPASCCDCVKENCVFFTIGPSLASIDAKDLISSQRNASVQSLLLAGNFLYNQ